MNGTNYLKEVQRFYEREPVVRISFELILSIFTVVFFLFFAIRPTLGTISVLLRRIDDQEEVNTKLDAKIAQLSTAQDLLIQIGPELEDLTKRAIPEGPQIKRLARQIEVLANFNGVLLTALEVQSSPLVGDRLTLLDEGKPPKGDRFVTFSFTAGGTQIALINFLAALERMERAVLLTQIGMSQPQATLKAVFPLVVSGKATVYYYLAPPEEG